MYMGALFVEMWPARQTLMARFKATCAEGSKFSTSGVLPSLDKFEWDDWAVPTVSRGYNAPWAYYEVTPRCLTHLTHD